MHFFSLKKKNLITLLPRESRGARIVQCAKMSLSYPESSAPSLLPITCYYAICFIKTKYSVQLSTRVFVLRGLRRHLVFLCHCFAGLSLFVPVGERWSVLYKLDNITGWGRGKILDFSF